MNTSLKSILTAVTLAAATLLTGCASPNMQATFNRGDEVLFGRIFNIWTGKDMLAARGILCDTKYPAVKKMIYSEDVDHWVKESNFCDSQNLDSIQQVLVGVGVVNANGDRFNLSAFPPKGFAVSEGDIVAIKVYPSSDGRFRRPSEILRVAAKAKDATKKNGCYWDAGTGVWSGFNQGGAICEGWHWKDHPYSNPDLLKK